MTARRLRRRGPRSRGPSARSAVLGLGAAALGGCAVMTIDVDVYKGPLTNSEHLQMQQMAVMAIGATPLLESVKAGLPEDGELWRHVEAVRTLYEDLPELMSAEDRATAEAAAGAWVRWLAQSGAEATERYREAYAILAPADRAEDEKAWRELSDAMRRDGVPHLAELKKSYRGFLVTDHEDQRDEGPVLVAHDRIWNALEADRRRELMGDVGPSGIDHGVDGANAKFRRLRDPDLLRAHANLLFPDDDERSKGRFVSRVDRVAASFLDARLALADVLDAVLRGLAASHLVRFDSPCLGQAVIEDAARLTAQLVQPRYLRHAMAGAGGTEDALRLRSALAPHLPAGTLDQGDRWNLGEAAEALRKAIVADPVGVALALRQLDARFAREPFDLDPARAGGWAEVDKFEKPAKREFGLARGPFGEAGEKVIDAGRIRESFQQMVLGLRSTFMRGRLPEGLYTLTEEYLLAASEHGPDAPEVVRMRALLSDALVRFAEKTLFMANNVGLVRPRDAQVDKYVAGLQAIGNSILVQVDSLRQRHDHRKRLARRLRAEMDAIGVAIELPEGGGLDELGELDRTIAKLRRRHVELVRTKGADAPEARNVARALETAREHRSGLLFVQPASAYLRSSYTATTLQGDPNLQWENLLAAHALRSVPGFRPGTTASRQAAEIAAELDKQHWQSVNRVRVAGGGNTNYAIAKDDIGNWYVKSYSADPEPIIEAAESLAAFNLGAHLDTDRLSGLQSERDGDGPALAEDAGRTTLERVFDRHAERFRAETQANYDGLVADLQAEELADALRASFAERWRGVGEDPEATIASLEGELTAASRAHLVPALERLERPATERSGREIVAALRAIRRFGADLDRRIGALDLPAPEDPAQAAARRNTRRDLAMLVRAAVVAVAERQREAVEDFETAVVFIGDSTGG